MQRVICCLTFLSILGKAYFCEIRLRTEQIKGLFKEEPECGKVNDKGKFPWLAALYSVQGNETLLGCGGSLISSHWVLTTAFCAKLHLKFAEFENEEWSDIDARLPHPLYRDIIYNVGLLRLVTEITIAQPICLPFKPIAVTEAMQLLLAGWDMNWINGSVFEKQDKTSIFSTSDCNDKHASTDKVSVKEEHHICTDKESVSGCKAVKGGALMFQMPGSASYYQIGILVTGNKGCVVENYLPAIYQKVQPQLLWIADTIVNNKIIL